MRRYQGTVSVVRHSARLRATLAKTAGDVAIQRAALYGSTVGTPVGRSDRMSPLPVEWIIRRRSSLPEGRIDRFHSGLGGLRLRAVASKNRSG